MVDPHPMKEESNEKSPETISTSENRASKSPDNGNPTKSNNNPAGSGPIAASAPPASPVAPEPSPPRSASVPPPLPASATSTPRQHATPIMTNPPTSNPNRPPSTSSVHSNTSGGAARTTTTSRRGGRTRCRSPPAMSNRPGSSLGNTGGGGSSEYGGGGPDTPYGPPPESPYSDRRGGPGPATSAAPPSPANPSEAAAAAAAAAKALSNSSGGNRNAPPSSWVYNDGGPETGGGSSGRDYGSRRHREGSSRYHHPSAPSSSSHHRHHHYHDSRRGEYHGSSSYHGTSQRSSWPDKEGGPPPPRRSRDYGAPHAHHRQHPDDHYGSSRDGYHYSYPSGRGRNSDRYPPHYEDEYDQRFSDHHHSHRPPPPRSPYGGSERMSRRGPPPPHDRSTSPLPPPYGGGPAEHHMHGSSSGRRRGGDPYSYKPGGMTPLADGGGKPPSDPSPNSPPPGSSRAEVGAPSSVKTTRVIIGTETPIHIRQAADPSSKPSSSRRDRGGRPADVFRGRPGSDLPPPPRNGSGGGVGEKRDDDSPQKILLSLRTPTTSFEEKQPPTVKANNSGSRRSPTEPQDPTLPLSPVEPPQIRNSNHQMSNDSNSFNFEPQRSPKSQTGPPQPTNSIEMAPSFSLFNQSFDSFGDTAQYFNVGGPLDAALQSPSFGAGPTASVDNDKGDQLQLHRSMSGGNYAQQLLGGSGSGALTFGMSPNNSFGNGSASIRNSNITLLGGQDGRSASPTQVLGMYRSYSGSGSPRPKGDSLDDAHLRMSGGSFGAPSIGNSYTRSFGGEGPPPAGHYRTNSMGHGQPDTADGPPRFYLLLKKYRAAFKECTFLLPGLKAAVLDAPLADAPNDGSNLEDTSNGHGRERAQSSTVPDHLPSAGRSYGDSCPQDTAIAVRRIASAVCAFGGTIMGDRASLAQQKANSQSIFREKDAGDSATVTPSSTSSTPQGSRNRQKVKYDEQLPSRYYENDNRLSWEFEENPPVDDVKDDEDLEQGGKNGEGNGDSSKSKNGLSDGKSGKRARQEGNEASKQANGEGGKKAVAPSPSGDQPKMRYRCKLCGQPKQNHTCPYQQSLARSIGAMVYPAVNAFTSAEPGILAPALSEMNNFVVSGSESVSSAETSPSRPTPDRIRRLNQTLPSNTNQVTPESLRGTARGSNSPISAMSTGSATPQRSRTPGSSSRKGRGHGMGQRFMGGSPSSSSRKKRSHAQMGGSEDQGDLLFVESMELKPEQFRIVTQSKATSSADAFTYPALPLPYAQRKRLSDNLFSLSKEVPQLTDECAAVLREAREKDLWDLAVAELMTQVVVVVHCPEGDFRLEGLRRYLLTLGIAC